MHHFGVILCKTTLKNFIKFGNSFNSVFYKTDVNEYILQKIVAYGLLRHAIRDKRALSTYVI